MNTLISLFDEGVPLTAVGFVGSTPVNVIVEAKNKGLDIAELRLDHYSSLNSADVISEINKFSNFHTIATIRLENEGGKWNQSEEQRLRLFRDIIPHVDAVDIELHAESILPLVIQEAHNKNKLALVSYHNFIETPSLSFLQSIVNDAWSKHADLIKVAVQIDSLDSLQVLAELTLSNKDKRLITIAMGSEGLISRVFFPALGSRITFAYIGTPTAPGQLKFEDLFQLLREFYPRFNQKKIDEMEILEAA
jgi:3-dehydroquinate dehydratase-1